jgi:AcrR family transcriptional regulator
MTPRNYAMRARAASTEATRARVVKAAMRLHARDGVRSTSWQAIATEAGVSTATVYRHFPAPSDLIQACARQVFDLVRPPTIEEASVQFALIDDAADRFAHLARESAHCYQRGEGWLHAAHRERDFDPDLAAAVSLIQDTLHVLVEAAARKRLGASAHATMFTVCDFPFWKALVDRGLSYRTAERTLIDLVRAETVRLGLSSPEMP